MGKKEKAPVFFAIFPDEKPGQPAVPEGLEGFPKPEHDQLVIIREKFYQES
jgi:hypothetical protein